MFWVSWSQHCFTTSVQQSSKYLVIPFPHAQSLWQKALGPSGRRMGHIHFWWYSQVLPTLRNLSFIQGVLDLCWRPKFCTGYQEKTPKLKVQTRAALQKQEGASLLCIPFIPFRQHDQCLLQLMPSKSQQVLSESPGPHPGLC